ncbi:MAG: radical SAM protein [Thermoplasmata archaeon]
MDNEYNLPIYAKAERKKAELISCGILYVPSEIHLPVLVSRSTAGPGAGSHAVAFEFEGLRIKLPISRKRIENGFALVEKDGIFSISRIENGKISSKPFIEKIEFIQTLMHAPRQAFVNIHASCIYRCTFCTTPRLTSSQGTERTKGYSLDQWVDAIVNASGKKDFESFSVTSGIYRSVDKTVEDIAYVVKHARDRLLERNIDTPIGVEPYVEKEEQIKVLKEAGATELKLNLHSYDKEYFKLLCPDWDYENVKKMLSFGVKIFGKGKVCSNIIFGLGESDEIVLSGVEYLASEGIIATLRAVRVNEGNRQALENAFGKIEKVDAERMIRLAEKADKIMQDYGLCRHRFNTMCLRCKCCDIL